MTTATPGDEPASASEAAPGVIVRAHTWVLDRWPTTLRRRIAVIAVLVAVGFVVISTVARLIGAAVDAGILAYIGLMVVCWVGAGGALVPVPGVRPLSWVMIVHQSTLLVAPIVALIAALAMVLGQSSYFLTTRAQARRHREGHGHQGKEVSAEQGRAAPGDGEAVGDVETPASKPPHPIVARSRAVLAKGQAAVEKRMTTHPQRILFLLCVVPNPLTTFATMSAASTGLAFARFFAASVAGFLVLTIALVVAGQGILLALGLA